MKVFVDFPSVENDIKDEINCKVKRIMLSKTINGTRTSAEVIDTYLTGAKWESRLKAIIGLSGGSLERLKRVYTAITGNRSFPNLNEDAKDRATVAKFLASSKTFSSAAAPDVYPLLFPFTQGVD